MSRPSRLLAAFSGRGGWGCNVCGGFWSESTVIFGEILPSSALGWVSDGGSK